MAEQFLLATTALIGFVNILQFALDGNWKSFIKGMTAVVLGGVFGFFKFYGVPSIEMGLLVGLSSSGLFKLTQNFTTLRQA